MLKKILFSAFAFAAFMNTTSAQNEVMLQGFYWDSYTDTKWTKLEKQAEELANYFDLIWIPNSGYCGGSNNMGYMPLYYWNQNSSFGTEAELRSMIKTFKSKGLGTIADVVINHHNTSNGWFGFPSETYNGETYQFQATDICSNDDSGAAKTEADKEGVSISKNTDTGTDWDGCRDLDHKSSNVNKIIKAYLDYLLNDLGYTGFRYDMVKGYGAVYTADYNSTAKPAFSVGEYWDVSPSIKSWIDGTKVNNTPTSSAFDFQFRYRVRDAINQNNWTNLAGNASDADGYPLAYQDDYKQWAVTFVENHDTEKRTSAEQDPINKDTLAANAYLLAMPGTPCVFFKHWLDCKSEIKRMIAIRKLVGINNQSSFSNVVSGTSVYANKVDGTNGSLIVIVGKNAGVWTPSAYTSTHTKVLSGYHYSYYIENSLISKWNEALDKIVAEEEAEKKKEEEFTPYTATVYVKADFTPVYFYIWDSNNNTQLNGGWPGKQPSTTTINGETWYYQTVQINSKDYYFNIIFNQGNGKPQTSDITQITTDKYYEASLSGSAISYTDVTSTVAVNDINAISTSNSKMYNLMGVQISAPAKGQIYIMNGKKYIAK